MSKNGDKIRNFVDILRTRGHLARMVEGKGNYHLTKSELNKMGAGVQEAANHLAIITGDRKSVVVNDDGVSVKDASQKMNSYCQRECIDIYAPSTELTEPSMEELGNGLTY